MKQSRSKSQRFSDGGTLTLLVSPRGAANWIQRITVAGKRHDLGLGGWPLVSLAKARQRALANRVAVSDGRDPLAEKRRERTPTLREAAQDVRGQPAAMALPDDGPHLDGADGAPRVPRSG